MNLQNSNMKYVPQNSKFTRSMLFKKTAIPALRKSLDAGMLRGKAVANNIANVNTEGYQRVEVDFEKELSKAIDRSKLKGFETNQRHLSVGRRKIEKVKPESYRPYDPTLPSGVNNVDIDMEMGKLAENQILFNYGVRFTQQRYKAVNGSIKGRSLNY